MTKTTSTQDLGRRIEQVVEEHIAESRRAAQEAVVRAFATANRRPSSAKSAPRATTGRTFERRSPEEVAALGERLYGAVCTNPGAAMAVFAAEIGATVRELNRPMTLLKRAGRVRSVGARHRTRYFPMAGKVAASA
jgi:hypothetical protein